MLLVVAAGCASAPAPPPADIILDHARVYTLTWPDPAADDGTPHASAPFKDGRWSPDAEAIAITGNRITFVGTSADAAAYRGPSTRVVDVQGATVVPGLVDSHTHVVELGQKLRRVDLTGVATEAAAVARVRAAANTTPDGDWIVGQGWDEGAWASHYPTAELLSAQVPEHPVYLASLHGFAGWGNRLAFERAGITSATKNPVGGEILRDARGTPTGVVLNRAVPLLADAVPPLTDGQFKDALLEALRAMARDGYVAIHEAGVDSRLMRAYETLDKEGQLPIRVYVMLSARDAELSRAWLSKGPETTNGKMLTVRAVKAYYDGALGSRGARLLEDYSDTPGHRGVSGEGYGFDRALVADLMRAGFQVGIHAIGDAGTRETLEFIESVLREAPSAKSARHRIEHAQVVHPDDFARIAASGLIASMEPPHAVEDKPWAEARLGAERIKGAYAWRSMRQAGVPLVFNSDLTGSDHGIFYGLHSAITRRDRAGQPAEGWYAAQRMAPEEALRGYSTWAAYAAHWEAETGVIAAGRWADLTALSIDPLDVGARDPRGLLAGAVTLTMVAGRIVHDAQ